MQTLSRDPLIEGDPSRDLEVLIIADILMRLLINKEEAFYISQIFQKPFGDESYLRDFKAAERFSIET